jgi:hypothetical protein
MALGGRYHTMFTLQAERFTEGRDADEGEEPIAYDVLS